MSPRSTVPATELPSRRSLRSRRRRRSTLVTGLAVGPLLLVGVSAAFAYPHFSGSWTGAKGHRTAAASTPSVAATIPATTWRPVTSYADTIHPTVGDATSTSVAAASPSSRSASAQAVPAAESLPVAQSTYRPAGAVAGSNGSSTTAPGVSGPVTACAEAERDDGEAAATLVEVASPTVGWIVSA
jgi:hypothetical protein